MPKHLSTHALYTVIFLLLLLLDGIFMYAATPNRTLQVLLLLGTALFYVFWGVLHHALRHDIHLKIVIEYVLVSALGIAAVLFFLKS